MVLEASAFERRLTYKGAVSGSVNTATAILAGSSAATDLLYLVLLDPVDRLVTKYSSLDVFMIADDITLRIEGTDGDEVARVMGCVVNDCVKELEGGLRMTISRDSGARSGTTVALASDKDARGKVDRKLKRFGIRTKQRVRNLGVDFSMGKRGGRGPGPEQRARAKEADRRAKRAGRLGTTAAPWLIRGATVPSALYGTAVTGITDLMAEKLRTDAARAYGPLRGRSATARLIMENNDPGLLVVKKPLMAWVEAV